MSPQEKLQSLLDHLKYLQDRSERCSDQIRSVHKDLRQGYRELKDMYDSTAKQTKRKLNQHRQKYWLWD